MSKAYKIKGPISDYYIPLLNKIEKLLDEQYSLGLEKQEGLIVTILTRISISGALLVSLGYPLYANLLWSISNPLLAYHNYKIAQNDQAELFIVFTLIAWFGIIYSFVLYYI